MFDAVEMQCLSIELSTGLKFVHCKSGAVPMWLVISGAVLVEPV
jgi:hypothetical protein